jgi:hypothetical protein
VNRNAILDSVAKQKNADIVQLQSLLHGLQRDTQQKVSSLEAELKEAKEYANVLTEAKKSGMLSITDRDRIGDCIGDPCQPCSNR